MFFFVVRCIISLKVLLLILSAVQVVLILRPRFVIELRYPFILGA